MIDIKMNTIEEDIIDLIVDAFLQTEVIPYLSFFTRKDIFKNIKYSNLQISNALQRLKEKEYIINDGKKWYCLHNTHEIIDKEKKKRGNQNELL